MSQAKKILGLILSGGAGERINGRDKGLINYQGQQLVTHVLKRVTPQVDEVYICIHRNHEQYKAITGNLIVDAESEHEGPLAGITAGIEFLQAADRLHTFDYLAIFPCDVPTIPMQLVPRLVQSVTEHKAEVAVAHDGERRQNLHCLVDTDVCEALLTFYDNGGRAMRRWFKTVETIDADFSDVRAGFINLNTPSELAE